MRRYLFIAFVAVAFTVMAGAVTLRAVTSQSEGGGERGGRETPVAVHTVETHEFADVVEALGTARANESVTITAKVSDVIARLEFDSGDRVEAGEIMVELADAEEAAGLSEARATLRETNRDVERIRDLTERGVAPRSRLDEAVAAVERARARVEAIEARVADRIIRAPFSGVVGLRNVSEGELVRPGDVIAQLDDAGVIKLDFTVPERFLSVLETGQTVRARSDAWPDTVFEGEVDQIDSRVDEATRAVTVRALIDNADGRLRPGMLMTVELRRAERERPAVPGAAVVRLDQAAYVFALDETGQTPRAVRRDVELGQRTAGVVEVLGGLEPGDRIVAEGVHRLTDGAPVVILRETGGSRPDGRGGETAAGAIAAPAAG
ncbi:MAG: efflux RND transporter periplasmic adaptor subunit [Oceanicaulis sp.]